MLCRIALISIAALVAITACRFPSDIDLPRYASRDEIIGTWELSAGTLTLGKRAGYSPPAGRPHELVFRADGTCDFRSIIHFADKVDYLDAHGVWKLEHDVGSPPSRKNQLEISIDTREIPFYLMDVTGRVEVWYPWSDPDEPTFIRYAKRPNKTPEPTR
jgi:hypothetical protein